MNNPKRPNVRFAKTQSFLLRLVVKGKNSFTIMVVESTAIQSRIKNQDTWSKDTHRHGNQRRYLANYPPISNQPISFTIIEGLSVTIIVEDTIKDRQRRNNFTTKGVTTTRHITETLRCHEGLVERHRFDMDQKFGSNP